MYPLAYAPILWRSAQSGSAAVLLVALLALGRAWSADGSSSLSQYEIEGVIDQTIDDEAFPIRVTGQFKVFVRDGNWLIETIEDKQLRSSRQYLKREIGSTNGAEIFEMVTPLQPKDQQTNAVPQPAKNGRATATVVSSAVPVGQLDGSVVGHLWLMFASGKYLGGLQTNLLTPVYDVTASAPGDPNLKYRADWELLYGPGSLPAKVTYFYEARIVGASNIPHAVYKATGTTNTGGLRLPTGFVFERYVGGAEARVRKRATATVTAIRPVCSLDSLLPAVTSKAVVVDRRLAQADQPVRAVSYQALPNSSLPTVAQVKSRYDRKENPPKRSPVVVAVILITLCVPLLIWVLHFWKRRREET
jgi:hypothetical protein